MPEESVLPKDRIASSFKQLNVVSAELNSASRELGKSISSLEAALKGLNLGISAWHSIAGHEDFEGDGSFWRRDLGYTKIGNEWRIALKQVSGHLQDRGNGDEEVWAFNEAPRWMCVEAVGKLPDLFETLIKRVVETTAKLKARIPETDELVAAVLAVQQELESTKPKRRVR
jgi:hypothetical protein